MSKRPSDPARVPKGFDGKAGAEAKLDPFKPFQRLQWACQARPRTAVEKAVLVVLTERADKLVLNCWPSHATIADEARCSVSTAKRALQGLEADGFIEVVRPVPRSWLPPDRRRKEDPQSNGYRLRCDAEGWLVQIDLYPRRTNPDDPDEGPLGESEPTPGSNRTNPRFNLNRPPVQYEPLSGFPNRVSEQRFITRGGSGGGVWTHYPGTVRTRKHPRRRLIQGRRMKPKPPISRRP